MNELKIYCYEMIFDTSLNQNYILNIENPKILREFIGALQNKDDSKIYYMKNYQIVGKFDKNILYLYKCLKFGK